MISAFSAFCVLTTVLSVSIDAWAIPPRTPTFLSRRTNAASQLAAILANPNACPSSVGECVTPQDAVTPILNGLSKYNILTAPEQAAVVSWMAFESVDFQFNHNVSPGTPGQGTRAMLMPNFIKLYIDDLPELTSAEAAAGGDVTKLLALVQDNAHSFAAGSWFYSTQCSDAVKNQVKTGGKAGWAAFISTCVHTDATDQNRIAYWERACKQLGVPTA